LSYAAASSPSTGKDGKVEVDSNKATRASDKVFEQFPDAQKISTQDAVKLAGRENAGPNARHFSSWIDEGGDVFYDSASDSFIYGKTIKTKTLGEEHIHIAYKPDVKHGGIAFLTFQIMCQKGSRLMKLLEGVRIWVQRGSNLKYKKVEHIYQKHMECPQVQREDIRTLV